MAKFLFYAFYSFFFLAGCREEKSEETALVFDPLNAPDTVLTSNQKPSYNISANYPTETGMASYYADRFHGRKTASGELYDTAAFTAAHRTLPFGTLVSVIHISTGDSVVVRINDRGPHSQKRIIDLSKAAAKALKMYTKGIARVTLKPHANTNSQRKN
ncbi:MAG: septal ring lytic transglycosylase RlpA family protein [Bacteroidetes bacterium]|nr:septal ring lytic transglycosylase RlpA family protein [Bacteroidota bacterium]